MISALTWGRGSQEGKVGDPLKEVEGGKGRSDSIENSLGGGLALLGDGGGTTVRWVSAVTTAVAPSGSRGVGHDGNSEC